METVLKVEGLSKRYGSAEVVTDIALTVEKGQVFGILGPNGSGKTTTLGMILGVIRPSRGRYQWFGQTPSAKNRRRIGAILERPAFSPYLSGEANLKIVAAIRGVPQSAQAIARVLDQLKLTSVRRQAFKSYSLGMKQRLAMAAALLGSPDVLVLDEPTNGVDAAGIAEIRHAIQALADSGTTILLASHILDEVEKLCSHVAVFKKGRILESGSIAEVLSHDDAVELAARDMELLGRALADLQASRPTVIKTSVRRGDAYHLSVGPGFDPAHLNSELHARSIVLGHLMVRRKSLETHFLEVLEKN